MLFEEGIINNIKVNGKLKKMDLSGRSNLS